MEPHPIHFVGVKLRHEDVNIYIFQMVENLLGGEIVECDFFFFFFFFSLLRISDSRGHLNCRVGSIFLCIEILSLKKSCAFANPHILGDLP